MAAKEDSEDSQQGVVGKADWPYGVQPKSNSPARSLMAMDKMDGWPDPTKIYDLRNGTTEDISGWDHAREANNDPGLGNIPTNDPPKEYYGRDANAIDPTGGPKMDEKILFNYPDVSREARVSGKPKRTLSNPDPGNF
jgi:hypothetical protein